MELFAPAAPIRAGTSQELRVSPWRTGHSTSGQAHGQHSGCPEPLQCPLGPGPPQTRALLCWALAQLHPHSPPTPPPAPAWPLVRHTTSGHPSPPHSPPPPSPPQRGEATGQEPLDVPSCNLQMTLLPLPSLQLGPPRPAQDHARPRPEAPRPLSPPLCCVTTPLLPSAQKTVNPASPSALPRVPPPTAHMLLALPSLRPLLRAPQSPSPPRQVLCWWLHGLGPCTPTPPANLPCLSGLFPGCPHLYNSVPSPL